MEFVWSPALVQWPAETNRRDDLRAAGIPRLLVVAEGHAPPDDVDVDEDFVLLPSNERDVAIRLENLGIRVRDAVHLDDQVISSERGQVVLTEREAKAMRLLLDRRGQMTSRDSLVEAVGGPAVTERQLHDVMYRLRTRLKPLGLDVFSARSKGYILGLRIEDAWE